MSNWHNEVFQELGWYEKDQPQENVKIEDKVKSDREDSDVV